MPTTSLVPTPRYQQRDTTTFAHLFPRDRSLWRAFLADPRSDLYIGYDYDVKVGAAAKRAIAAPTPENMLALGTLAKRIDAVGFITPLKLDIIEIKPENPAAATGQLLSYQSLFIDTYPQLSVRHLVLVTTRDDDELLAITRAYGIIVHVLQPTLV